MRLIILLLLTTTAHAQFLEGQTPISEFEFEVRKATFVPQLLQLAAATYEKKEYKYFTVVMERLNELQPHYPEHELRLVEGYALLDEKTKAYDILLKMQKKGLAYPISELANMENLMGTEVYDYIDEAMKQNTTPFGEGTVAMSVDKNYGGLLYENMTWDKASKSFLLGSVRNGEIIRLDEKGQRSVFIPAPKNTENRWAVVDLEADNARDILWVATASMPQYNGMSNENLGETALLKYQLSSGKLLQTIGLSDLEKPNLISQLHVSAQGDVYVLNSFKRLVLKLSQGQDKLEPLLGLKDYDDVRAMTTDDTGRYLYFADFARGIFVVDLQGKHIGPMGDVETMVLGGTEEMIFHKGALIVVQNGFKPARVMRLKLENPVTIEKLIPIEASNPNFEIPTNGVLTDSHFYYIGNSQWSKMDMMGNLLPEQQWAEVRIMRSPFNFQEEKRDEVMQKIEDFKKEKGIQ